MKKIIYFIIIFSIISIGYSLNYLSKYHIEDNKTVIQSSLKDWLNRGSGSIDPDVLNIVQLDDTSSYVVLFETQNSNIGYAHLIKGWNGKYKIDQSAHGTNVVSYRKIKTIKGIYGILVGKNPGLKIDHIKVDLYYGNFIFTSNVSTDKKFVRYEKLPNDVEKHFPAELTYYDNDGSEIELSELLN